MGFKKFPVRAVRDDTKQIRMKCPMAITEISFRGIQKSEEAMYAGMDWKVFPQSGTIEPGLEKMSRN